jgi:hypothetical protein
MKLDQLHHFSTRELAGPNWKVAMDGYLEVYHFATLHRKTFNRTLHSNVFEVEPLGRHQRMFFARRGITDLKQVPEDDWQVDSWLGSAVNVFPNVQIASPFVPANDYDNPEYGQHWLIHMIYPGASVDTSVTRQINLTTRAVTTEADRKTLQHISDETYDIVLNEDYWVGQRIQRALNHAAPEFLMCGRNEPGVAHYHAHLEELLKE